MIKTAPYLVLPEEGLRGRRLVEIPTNIAEVLVVDDDIAICRIVQLMLPDELYSVESSRSVADALEAVGNESFDVYVLDYKLRDGSGFDVAERIRSKWGAAPIILMSGYDSSAVAVRSEKLGISNFLEKPFSREILCNAVKNAIGLFEESGDPVESGNHMPEAESLKTASARRSGTANLP